MFRHVPFEGLGLIAAALERSDVRIEHADLYTRGAALPNPDAADGLIIMGGPMSANDEFDYLKHEMAVISSFISAGKPILGVCLGAQLIAKTAGARIYRNREREIGWAPVYWTDAGRQDRLFRGLEQPEPLFHWHSETFDLPAGAVWLAYSDRCRNQAFRLGDTVYGLQFHLEVTPQIIDDWCRQDANEGDFRELERPIDSRAHAARLSKVAAIVFDRWCALLPQFSGAVSY